MSYPPYGSSPGYPPQQTPLQYPSQQTNAPYPNYPGAQQPQNAAYPPYGANTGPAPPGFNVPAGQPPASQYPPTNAYPSPQQQQNAGYGNYTPYGGAAAPSMNPTYGGSPAYPAYPQQQPAYPQQQPAYSQQQPAYPQQQPAYPSGQPHSAPYGAYPRPTTGQPSYGAGSGFNQSPVSSYPNASGGYANFGAGNPMGQQSQFSSSNMNITPLSHNNPVSMCQGTVRPSPNFNANSDADAIKKAMRGLGCDSKAIINILCFRSNAQRQQIRQMFKTMYGKDIIQELIKELSGNLEDLILALMYTPEEFDARELENAMRGAGTTESTLIEIMTTRTNAEIQAVKHAFRTLYGRDLEQALSNETSGHFRRLLVSLSVGGRDESTYVDRARAAAQAKELYDAGERQWGTNESAFNAVMVATNSAQLGVVFEEYQKLTGHDIEQAVNNEFSSDILDGLLAVVKIAKNRPAYFAEKANLAMRGMGTNDRALIRVIVSRCEKDMVQIKQEYQRLYGKTLENDIAGDTSGKYKEAFLALVRGA